MEYNRHVKSKRAIMITTSVLVLVLACVLTSMITILALSSQQVQSRVSVTYIADGIKGSMRLRAYHNGGWHNLTNPSGDGYVNLSEENIGSADLENINLDVDNKYVVIECAFKSTTYDVVKFQFAENPDANNSNMLTAQLISRDPLNVSEFTQISLATSAFDALTVVGTRNNDYYLDDYVYYYFKVGIDELGENATYIADHVWSFTKVDLNNVTTLTINNTNGNTLNKTIPLVDGACLPIVPYSQFTSPSSTGVSTQDSQYAYSYAYKGHGTLYGQLNGYYSEANYGTRYMNANGEPLKAVSSVSTLYSQYMNGICVTAQGAARQANINEQPYGKFPLILPSVVTSIDEDGWEDNVGITSVTFPSTVSSISAYAFENCDYLKNVEMSNNITSIGTRAFYGCKSLTNLKLSSGLTTIALSAFDSCSGLNSVTIPNGVTTIGQWAFCDCSSLTSVTLPEGLQVLEDGAFTYTTSLTSIVMPASITTIGCFAFGDDAESTGLTTIYYKGTQSQWNAVDIDDDADYNAFDYIIVYYFSDTDTGASNIWHYDNNNNPVLWR